MMISSHPESTVQVSLIMPKDELYASLPAVTTPGGFAVGPPPEKS